MRIETFTTELGDLFDGVVLLLTEEEYRAFHKLSAKMSRTELMAKGLTESESNTVQNFYELC